MAETDVASDGFGFSWGHTRSYTNVPISGANSANGVGWVIDDWPSLDETTYAIPVSSGSSSSEDILIYDAVDVIWGADQGLTFIEIASTPDKVYESMFGDPAVLLHDAAAKEYTLEDRAGNKSIFNDFEVTDGRGKVKRLESVGAATIEFNYTGSQLTSMKRSSGALWEYFNYAYFSSGPNTGFISSVTHARGTAIRKADYTYYEAGDAHGSTGMLKTVTRSQRGGVTWDVLGTQYYRYYTNGVVGSDGNMQFALSPEAFQKLTDDPSVSDPFTAPEATVSLYADFKFEYDNLGRVDREWVRAGSMEFTYAYSNSTNEIGSNSWSIKTEMTKPDGSTETVFMNYSGSTMLRVLKDGSDEWCHFQRYDTDGKVILEADAAAISGYDESLEDLLGYNESSGSYQYLRNSDGLIRLTSYIHEDYVHEESIKEGQNGTEILVSRSTYLQHQPDPNGESIYLIERATTFPDATDPRSAIITTYGYTFFTADALKMKVSSRTTTLPVIPTDQNGSGVANSIVETIDECDQVTELTNEEGIKTKWTYDNITGGVTQQIADVGDSSHFNLTTDFTLDNLGRVIEELGPFHDVQISFVMKSVRTASWTVYDDAGHQVRVAVGYKGIATGSERLINPVSITQFDKNGNVLESIQATRASTIGKLLPTDVFAQADYVRWSTTQYTECCMAASQRVYHNIPTSGAGTSGTNYDQTNFGYDSMDRRNRVVTPGGTITATVFDVRNLPERVYVGTNDDGGTENDPTGGGTDPDNNMVVITTNEYDDGQDGGDGNLTKQIRHVDSNSANDRMVESEYDFRNRMSQSKTSDGTTTWLGVPTYDNMGRVTQTLKYRTSVSASNLIAKQESEYDNLSRVFKTTAYGVDPSNGAINPNAQISESWFSKTGRVMKEAPSGSKLFSKMQYDTLGRQTRQFVGYGPGTIYAEAESVTGDTILEQMEVIYDDSGFVTETISYQRNHDGTGTGTLTTSNSRVSYSYGWQDSIGRPIATAVFGTNGGSAPAPRGTVPVRSDTVLVSTTEYDVETGDLESSTDPEDTETRLEYDDAGRQLKLIQNYVNGSVDDDANITTQKTYNSDGNVSTLSAWNADTGNQVTVYEYGTTLSDSEVATSLLTRRVKYPDSVSDTDSITVTYNRQAQPLSVTDQLGTVHEYSYDELGRQTQDAVTAAGTDVDTAVLRLKWQYDVRGLLEKATSYDSATAGSVTNQVQWAYNDFSQMTTSYQSHSGAVNTGTSPKVQYGYADGSNNTLRPTSLTYPDGRVLTYDYGTAGGMDDKASRVSGIKDGATTLAGYTYLGLGSVVEVDYTQPNVQYDLIGASAYAGLDRFNRIIDSKWKKSSTDLDRIEYGYDRDSNRTYREVPTDTSNRFDELYSHDGMHRLDDLKRGQLNGSHTGMTSTDFQQAWTLDETGNWTNFKQDDNGNGSWDLVQDRTSNKANEIIDLNNTTGSAWGSPLYDKAGNMTRIPNPDSSLVGWNELTVDNWHDLTVDEWHDMPVTKDDEAVYDAWNRLVRQTREGQVLQETDYDALRRRVTTLSYTSGTPNETRHTYFTSAWQAIEERVDAETDAERQNVWGMRYIDDQILRDQYIDVGGVTATIRLYALQDGNWNVTSICNTSGTIQERYAYDAYGKPIFLTSSYGPKSISGYDWKTLFAGYHWDSNTGQYSVRHRAYSPTIGNWLQRDPIGYAAFDTNLYRYTFGQPTKWTDPSGEVACLAVGGALAVIAIWELAYPDAAATPSNDCDIRYAQTLTANNRDTRAIGTAATLPMVGPALRAAGAAPALTLSAARGAAPVALRAGQYVHAYGTAYVPTLLQNPIVLGAGAGGVTYYYTGDPDLSVGIALIPCQGGMGIGRIRNPKPSSCEARRARRESLRYFNEVKKRLFEANPNTPRTNPAFPRNTEWDEFHHWLIPQRANWAPNWLKHHPLNLLRVPGTTHARLDPYRFRFLRRPYKSLPEFQPYGFVGRICHGTPTWAKGAFLVGTGAGTIYGYRQWLAEDEPSDQTERPNLPVRIIGE